MEFLAESPVVSEQRHPLIERALERYDAGDYISSIHTFVFQVEGILRDFAGLLGQPVNEERDGITQARPLGRLLRDEKLREVLGDQLAESLEALLDNQVGPNIRNAVAHGLAAPEAFTEEIANLLIAFLLQVSAFRPADAQAPDEMPSDAAEGKCGGPEGEPAQ
jgi:phosphoglycolate phosphatase-like HAD superfamily hydrolase